MAAILLTIVDVQDLSVSVDPAEVLEAVCVDTDLEQAQLDTLKAVIDNLDPI